MSLSWLYDFSSETTEPPTSSQLRADSADPALITRLWIRDLTTDGIDAHRLLLAVPLESLIYVQDKNDHTRAMAFDLAAAPVDKTTYVEWPVSAPSATGAALLNNQAILVMAIAPTASGPTPGPGAPLVTLTQAKQHLLIPIVADDPGDADLALKLEAAQATILDYIGSTPAARDRIATWTAATVPPFVHASILLQLGELWRFRGDDVERQAAPRDATGGDLSPAIVALLRRTRDPVVA